MVKAMTMMKFKSPVQLANPRAISFIAGRSSIPGSTNITTTRYYSSSTTNHQVHDVSMKSFDSNHSLYDKVRPSYDINFVNHFLKDLNLVGGGSSTSNNGVIVSATAADKNKKVLELAAGTGKFTQLLYNAGWDSKDNLTIVEPSSGMTESLVEKLPSLKSACLKGDSYHIPLDNDSVDAVIVAQGFHWFADETSLHEINRVLKPNGKLGLIWNFDASSRAHMLTDERFSNYEFVLADPNFKSIVEDYLMNEVIANEIKKGSLQPERKIRRLIELLAAQTRWDMLTNYMYQYGAHLPQYYQGKWRKVFKNQSLFKNSTVKEAYTFAYPKLATELVFPYWESRSYITEKSDEEKQAIKEKVEEMVAGFEDFAFSDETKNEVMMFLGCHYYVLEVNK